jgi:heme-degrading monooxygenase HmoA
MCLCYRTAKKQRERKILLDLLRNLKKQKGKLGSSGRSWTIGGLLRKSPIFQQLKTDLSPAILVNIFHVAEADVLALLKAWESDSKWMKQQPGFISTRLHQGMAGSNLSMNYAVWESVAHFRAAFNHPAFKKALEQYPSSVVTSPQSVHTPQRS